MRYPDITLYPRITAALKVALLGLACLIGTASLSRAAPSDELVKLRKQLSASTARQEEISQRLQLLSGEIATLKKKSVHAAARLKDIDQKMIDTEQKLTDIQAVEKQTFDILSRQNTGLADTLSALLQLSRQPEGSLIGSPENLIDTLRAATLLQAVIPALKKQADQLAEQLDALAALRDQSIAEQQKYASLRAARSAEQKTLDQFLSAKKQSQSALASRNNRERRTQRQLAAKAKDLVTLMARLESNKKKRLQAERLKIEKEISRQKKLQQLEAAKLAKLRASQKQMASLPPKPSSSRKSVTKKPITLSALGTSRPFSSIKGTLPLPVGGRIISNYRKTRKTLQRSGIVIQTRAGAAVIAPYDGQIAFAGPFRQYGLLLIIDHGGGYHTLLAGLGTIDGEVGQLLLAGEPVGRMSDKKSVKPTLYMELRVKGSPVNPIPWLSAGNRKVSG